STRSTTPAATRRSAATRSSAPRPAAASTSSRRSPTPACASTTSRAGRRPTSSTPAARPCWRRSRPPTMTTWLLLAIAFGVGALITVQIGTNTRLKEALGDAVPAVIISSLLGVVILVGVTLLGRTPWPSATRIAGAPWWAWLGGLLGAVYAVATVLLARRLGAATLTAVVVTGQLVCSVVLD